MSPQGLIPYTLERFFAEAEAGKYASYPDGNYCRCVKAVPEQPEPGQYWQETSPAVPAWRQRVVFMGGDVQDPASWEIRTPGNGGVWAITTFAQ